MSDFVCVYRLQHEVSVLQQQLCENRSLVRSLRSGLQSYHRVTASTHLGETLQYEHPWEAILKTRFTLQ